MRLYLLLSFLFLFQFSVFSQSQPKTAYALAQESEKKESLKDSIAYIEKNIPSLPKDGEKRAAYIFLASIQEQAGMFAEAEKAFAKAAGFQGENVEKMSNLTSEQLVLNAIRCALSCGNYGSAENYINSLRTSSKSKTIAYAKLYEQWCNLIKAESAGDVEQIAGMLKAYLEMSSMKEIFPEIYLTLWHLTGEKKYSDLLKKDYPLSSGAAIVSGKIQLLPSPFWYFVPKSANAEPEMREVKIDASSQGLSAKSSEKTAKTSSEKSEKSEKTANLEKTAKSEKSEKVARQQLGLFKDANNAKSLVSRLKEAGFAANIEETVRPSGTKYYVVTVKDDSEGTMGKMLRNHGFECYPVYE